MLYRFVDDQKAEGFPVERISDVVSVSTSAYYDWKKYRCGIPTVGELAEQRLVKKIRKIHGDSGGTYGEPRVTEALVDEGCVVNHKRVERLMRIHNIVGYTPTKRRVTTIPDAAHRIPDRIRRDFFPDDLDVKWCGDISYIPTWEGFLYLSFVEDLASRRIVGLSMASHMRAELVGDALTEALGTRGGDVTGVIFHSDRGPHGGFHWPSHDLAREELGWEQGYRARRRGGGYLPAWQGDDPGRGAHEGSGRAGVSEDERPGDVRASVRGQRHGVVHPSGDT